MRKSDSQINVLDFSLPLIAQLILTTLMSVIDLIMVGYNGGNIAVTTVSLSSSFIQTALTIVVSSGISVGIIALISRYRGEGNSRRVYSLINLSIICAIAIAAGIYLVLNIFKSNLLVFAGAKGDVFIYGIIYMRMALIASFFQCLLIIFSAVYIGLGYTRIPFIANILVFVAKLILGITLILRAETLKEIIERAALSYLLAFFLGTLYLVFYYVFYICGKATFEEMLYISRGDMSKLIKLSIPASLEEAFYAISRLLGNFIILSSGSVAYAANEIANSVENISITPGLGLGMAATSLVALYRGSNRKRDIKRAADSCALWAIIFMVFCAILFVFIPEHLVGFFSADSKDEMILLATSCLMIGAVEQPFIAISTVYASSIKGLGDTKSPMLVSVITGWIIRLPLIYYFIMVKEYGVTAVWWITAFQWAVDAVLLYIIFLYKYRKLRLRA